MNSQFEKIYKAVNEHILRKLEGLPPKFTYHSIGHTLDVLEQTQQIAIRENIADEEDLFFLQLASLYHDTGFLYIYTGHEAKSCELARNELPGFGVTGTQIEKICGMIMATKIPQTPYNKLEKIICDADLDYLGREDFEPISNQLFKEFLEFGFVKNEDDWMEKQISFFESHQYFTNSSQLLRNTKKMENLAQIKLYRPSGNR